MDWSQTDTLVLLAVLLAFALGTSWGATWVSLEPAAFTVDNDPR